MIQVLANQHQLVLELALPLRIVQRETLAAEVEDMAFGAFIKPENALSPKDRLRQLVVEKMLKLANGKGTVTLEGEGRKPIHR